MAKQSPSQTIGPYFAYALTPEAYGRAGVASSRLVTADTPGQHITIEGRVLDGEGAPVDAALVEIWQANAHGRYRHPADDRGEIALDDSFAGFGRAGTGKDGAFRFETVKPGPVPGQGNTLQAPHIGIIVFARGMLVHAYTRLYFSDEADANAEDPVLSAVDAARRGTLIARRRDTPVGPLYRFDICLQGENETVFFDA